MHNIIATCRRDDETEGLQILLNIFTSLHRPKVERVYQQSKDLDNETEDPDYRYSRCQGAAHPSDGRPQREVQVGPDKLEMVASFCYLGDMLSAAGGCELLTTTSYMP